MRREALGLALAAVFAATVGRASGDSVVLGVNGRANANASVATHDRLVAVVWSATDEGGATDIYAAVSRDAGGTFDRPTRVNDVPGDARVSGEQPPRVSLVPKRGSRGEPAVVVIWTTKRPDGTRLMSARSDDGGRSFGRASIVPGTDAAGNRGWQATTVDAKGRVDAVWIDHRELAQPATAAQGHHEHEASQKSTHDGVAMAQKSKLYVASLDQSIGPHAVATGVCYCCKTAIATGSNGAMYLAWRQVYAGNIRDIAFTSSRDGGRTFASPARVSDDRWVLDGCPENGPSLAVDRQGLVHIVWPTIVPGPTTDSEPTLALFYAVSRDGRQFTPRQRVPTHGVPRHPQLAIDPRGAVVIVWDEQVDGTRHIALSRAVWRGRDSVHLTREIIDDPGRAVYPEVAAVSNGIIAVWTSGAPAASTIRVKGVRP